MPIWFGSALGSAIGLVAILLGALWNASLTRKRDKAMMNDEAKSVASAIGAELAAYIEVLCGRMMQAAGGPEGRTQAAMQMMLMPAPVVWPALASKIGLLDAPVSQSVARTWVLVQWHTQLLEATVREMQAGEWRADTSQQRMSYIKDDIPAMAQTVAALTGESPDWEYLLP